MPYYEMKFDVLNKISDLAQSTIGRRPVYVGEAGRGLIIKVEFDPELTPTEQTNLFNAMPEWVKKLYTFSKKPGSIIIKETP